MSCCGGNCGCGSSCGCGKGCGGCKMYPDFSLSQEKNVEVRIVGVAPQAKHYFDDLEMNGGYENDGCNCSCGSSCSCTNCSCKK